MIAPRRLIAASLLVAATLTGYATTAAPVRGSSLAANWDQETLDRLVDEAIRRGVHFLEETGPRRPRGRTMRAKQGAGKTALILYTILKGGGSRASEAVNVLLHDMSQQTTLGTYDRGCVLMALEAHDPKQHRAWIESVAQGLIDTQAADGTWGYPSGPPDLSNTQYASLGLWAAAKAGVQVESAVWQSLAEGVLRYAVKGDAGFGYRAGSGASTGSMTTAGIGTLALCEQELSLAGRLEPELSTRLQARRGSALGWLTSSFAVGTNPGGSGHAYYYMYGLERMSAFAGLARIGEHDWYCEGAKWLLERQSADGSWSGNQTMTCFAVLFLKRATSRGRKGTVTSGPKVIHEWATDKKGAQVRVACKVEYGQPSARVVGLASRVLSDYVWPGSEGGGLRVQRVVYSVGGVPAAVAIGSPETPSLTPLSAAGLPALLYPTRPGNLVARIYLAPPPGTEGLPRYIESPPLEVDLPSVTPPSRLKAGTETLLESTRCSASTHFKPRSETGYPHVNFEPNRTVDGAPSSPWLTRPKDHEPKIKLTLKTATKASGLLIVPPSLPGYPEITLRVPTRVRITLNGRRRSSTDVSLAPTGRTKFQFAEPKRVKTIEVTILETTGPTVGPTGLGELSLVVAR